MSCRRVHELLSAYIDGELAPEESCFVEKHLWQCDGCEAELESLRYTKRLLGELARQRPREELERLLLLEAERIEKRTPSDSLWEAIRRVGETPIRPRAALATAALSLATLWAATSQLGTGSDDAVPSGTAPAGSYAVVNERGNIIGLIVPSRTRSFPGSFATRPFVDSDPLLTASFVCEATPAPPPPRYYFSLSRPRFEPAYVLAGAPQ